MSKRTAVTSSFKMPTLGEFLNRFVPRMSNKQEGTYFYGTDNKLPQEMIQLLSNNATLLLAIRERSKYVVANGFANEESAKFVVDKETGKTANELLADIAFSRVLFGSVDLYIKRTGKGDISAEATSHELIRRRMDGDYEVNQKWGQKDFRRGENIVYPEFQKVRKEGKYEHGGKVLGEILYYWKKDAISFHYPIPDWFAGEMDVRTSTELMSLDLEMAINSFMTSFVLTLIGTNLEEEKEEYGGQSYWDIINNLLNKFTGGTKDNADGTADRMRAMLMTAPTKAEVPILQQFDVQKIISGSIEKREALDKKLCINVGVNPVLVGFDAVTTLGNTQAIANASLQLSNSVANEQNDITTVFNMLWPGRDWSITRYIPISFIDPEVWAKMTDEEIRKQGGLPPLEKTIPSDAEKILTALSGLDALVANKVLEELTSEEKRSLLGLSPKTTA